MTTSAVTSLLKFCDLDTSFKILNSQSLRWSAPNLFGDTFELTHKIQVDIATDALLKSLVMEALDRLFSPIELDRQENRLTATIDRWREERRFNSEDEAEAVLQNLLSPIVNQQQIQIKKYTSLWRKYASSVRLCCFSDKPTNMSAWQRYGDNHSGVALEFSCGPNTLLTNPKRMSYTTEPPLITSTKQQANIAYAKEPRLTTANFAEKLLIKDRALADEREWRCFMTTKFEPEQDDQLWYDNAKFSETELKAIYLGLEISPEKTDHIITILKNHYKKTKIFKAVKVPNSYAIAFVQVPKL
ncbi:MAG: hypothetical protein ACI92E_001228 [Oceanicoccus sp.]